MTIDQVKLDKPHTYSLTATAHISKLDEMLKSKCDHKHIVNQIMLVATVLYRMGSKEHKENAHNQELIMEIDIIEIKKRHGDKSVYVITIIACVLQVGGGVTTFSSIFLKALQPAVQTAGSAISGIGGGVGILVKIPESMNQGDLAVLQFFLQQMQRKHGDSNESHKQNHQLAQQTLQTFKQIESEDHQAKVRMVESTR